MKFSCGLSAEEKMDAKFEKMWPLKNWHKWFAWKPVRVGHRDCRWLEYVERKNIGCLVLRPTWQYRPISDNEASS